MLPRLPALSTYCPLAESLQHRLSFDEGKRPQILSVEVEQIKSDEDALPLTEQQIPRRCASGIVNTGDLAIKDGAFYSNVFGNPRCEISEPAKGIPVPEDQFSLAVLNVSQFAETVDLQFIDERLESNGSARRESRMGRIGFGAALPKYGRNSIQRRYHPSY